MMIKLSLMIVLIFLLTVLQSCEYISSLLRGWSPSPLNLLMHGHSDDDDDDDDNNNNNALCSAECVYMI